MITKKNIPSLESLRKIKPRDLIYPSIFVLFFSIVMTVFFISIQFISKNINKSFSSEDLSSQQSLDIEKYKLVAKKLNIATERTSPAITAMPEITSTALTATSTPVVAPINKQEITITIKNSTTKKGVAAALAKLFLTSGFTAPKTGNEEKLYAETTILLKESKKSYEPLILEVMQKDYPSAVVKTTDEANDFDATIIIGAK